MRAIWLLSLTGLVACFTVDFSEDGGGAGGELPGGSPAQGAGPAGGGGQGGEGHGAAAGGGQGGSGGCQTTCDEDHRCGDDGCGGLCSNTPIPDTWGLATPTQTYAILPWPDTQSVFVASDKTQVRRVDGCTGLEMTTFSLPTGDGERQIRELALFGDSLFVTYNEPGGGLAEKRVQKVSARTLVPEGTAMPVGGLNEDRPYFGGDSGPAHIWMNLAVSGYVARIDAAGASCTRAIDFDAENPGGVVAFGDQDAIVAWSGATSGRLYHLVPSSAECIAVAARGEPFDTGQFPYGLAHNSEHVYVAMYGPINNEPKCTTNFEAGILRASLGTLNQEARSEFEPTGCINAFVDVVADVEAVFAVGAYEAEQVGMGGAAWVARFDPEFAADDAPVIDTFPGGALIGWKAAMDEYGLYVSGEAEDSRGFLIKCTRELQCGNVPN